MFPPRRNTSHRAATPRASSLFDASPRHAAFRPVGLKVGSRGPSTLHLAARRGASRRNAPPRISSHRIASFSPRGIQIWSGCRVERLKANRLKASQLIARPRPATRRYSTQRVFRRGIRPSRLDAGSRGPTTLLVATPRAAAPHASTRRNAAPRYASRRAATPRRATRLSTRHPGHVGCRVERPSLNAARRAAASRNSSPLCALPRAASPRIASPSLDMALGSVPRAGREAPSSRRFAALHSATPHAAPPGHAPLRSPSPRLAAQRTALQLNASRRDALDAASRSAGYRVERPRWSHAARLGAAPRRAAPRYALLRNTTPRLASPRIALHAASRLVGRMPGRETQTERRSSSQHRATPHIAAHRFSWLHPASLRVIALGYATLRPASHRSRHGIRIRPDTGSRGPTPCATLRRAPHRVSPQRTFPRRLASFFRHGIQRFAGCRVERLNPATPLRASQRSAPRRTAPHRATAPRIASHCLSTRHPVCGLDAGSRGPTPRRSASHRVAPPSISALHCSSHRIVFNPGDNPCSNHRVFWPRISSIYATG
jgi:hypothetical protein